MRCSANILIGTSGWYYHHWKDVFYGKDVKKSDWLSFYAVRNARELQNLLS